MRQANALSFHIINSHLVKEYPRVYANILTICESLNENVVVPILEDGIPKRLMLESVHDLSTTGLSMIDLFKTDERSEEGYGEGMGDGDDEMGMMRWG